DQKRRVADERDRCRGARIERWRAAERDRHAIRPRLAALDQHLRDRRDRLAVRAARVEEPLAVGVIGRHPGPSRWTVAGENAGRQTAMYSAPPASGVL